MMALLWSPRTPKSTMGKASNSRFWLGLRRLFSRKASACLSDCLPHICRGWSEVLFGIFESVSRGCTCSTVHQRTENGTNERQKPPWRLGRSGTGPCNRAHFRKLLPCEPLSSCIVYVYPSQQLPSSFTANPWLFPYILITPRTPCTKSVCRYANASPCPDELRSNPVKQICEHACGFC